MREENSVRGRSISKPHPSAYDAGLARGHGGSRASRTVSRRQTTRSDLNFTSESNADFLPRATAIDPALEVEVDTYTSVMSPPTAGPKDFDALSFISVSHSVLLWPVVVDLVVKSGIEVAILDLQCIRSHGSSWLWQREVTKHREDLVFDNSLSSSTLESGPAVFSSLTTEQLTEYSTTYFNTFNMLSPLLDLDVFMDGAVARFQRQGYMDNDPKGVLLLLVFALGQLAMDGVLARPTSISCGEYSGFRGGSITASPGLDLFNEARRRIGICDTQCHLENVQILLLQATYFEARAWHSDFWSSTSAAATACIVLIRNEQVDWSSSYGDLVKRAYWACVLQERMFDLDLRVGSTGVENLEDQIPFPHFRRMLEDGEQPSGPSSSVRDTLAVTRHIDAACHFVAMITLSRLMRRVDNTLLGYEITECNMRSLWQMSETTPHVYPSASASSPAHQYSGPPLSLFQELLRQLECWRSALPPRLQWNDDERLGFAEVESHTMRPHASFFSSLRNVGPSKIDHNVDIAMAQLRTRYYHARFLIHRPFVYKAMHARKFMTKEDHARCAVAIDAACLWPLSLAPPKNKKHLVPHLFSWTQNFLAMLIILQMCRNDSYLVDICRSGGVAVEDIESSIGLMIGWLEDVRKVDGIADWSMRVLGPLLYNGRETGSAS